jgi:hypothetical protein
MNLAVGQRVKHSKFGWGTVVDVLRPMFPNVRFDLTQTPKQVPLGELVEFREVSEAPTPIVASPATRPAEVQARTTLECLRQGIPPVLAIAQWTVGPRECIEAIGNALDRARRGKGQTISICGGYGKGKSHLATYAKEIAVTERRFATMETSLRSDAPSFGDGVTLLYALAESLTLPTTDRDARIVGLANALRQVPTHGIHRIPECFRPFILDRCWQDSENGVSAVEQYLCGRIGKTDAKGRLRECNFYPELEALYLNRSYDGVDRLYRQAEQLGGFTDLARSAGAEGTLIIIDELDHDNFGGSWPTSLQSRKLELLHRVIEIVATKPIVLLLCTAGSLDRELKSSSSFAEVGLPEFSRQDMERVVLYVIDHVAIVHPSPRWKKGQAALIRHVLDAYERKYKRDNWSMRYVIRAVVELCEIARRRDVDSLDRVCDVAL